MKNVDDPTGFCSAADSRLTVYPSISAAKHFWSVVDIFRAKRPNFIMFDQDQRLPFYYTHTPRRQAEVRDGANVHERQCSSLPVNTWSDLGAL